MNNNNEIGKRGEKTAITFLELFGYEILATNWRYKHKEIDIIAKHQNYLVIIEVKTRKNNSFEKAEMYVSREKQKNLIIAANAYIEQNKIDLETRFDIVAISYYKEKNSINIIRNAFNAC